MALVTSLSPETLSATEWLQANRQSWGIESGLHQRLDVSLNEDRCRVRSTNGLWVTGMFRRLANSLCMEWRRRQLKPQHKTTTDFHSAMGENNIAKAIRFVTRKCPCL